MKKWIAQIVLLGVIIFFGLLDHIAGLTGALGLTLGIMLMLSFRKPKVQNLVEGTATIPLIKPSAN